MSDKDSVAFEAIAEYCDLILETAEEFDYDYATFENSPVYYNSMLMWVQQIGERVKKLTDSGREELDRVIDSRDIIAVRNRIAHGYDSLHESTIWEIITDHIPELKAFCESQF